MIDSLYLRQKFFLEKDPLCTLTHVALYAFFSDLAVLETGKHTFLFCF